MPNFELNIQKQSQIESLFEPTYDYKCIVLKSKDEVLFKLHFDLFTVNNIIISFRREDDYTGEMQEESHLLTELSAQDLSMFENGNRSQIIYFIQLLETELTIVEYPKLFNTQIKRILNKVYQEDIKQKRKSFQK